MRTKTVLLIIASAIALLAATVVAGFMWFKHAPRQTPPGQPALASLDADSLQAFRDAFNAAADETRVLLLFSPT